MQDGAECLGPPYEKRETNRVTVFYLCVFVISTQWEQEVIHLSDDQLESRSTNRKRLCTWMCVQVCEPVSNCPTWRVRLQ